MTRASLRAPALGVSLLVGTVSLIAASRADTIYVNGTCGDNAWTGRNADCAAPDGPKATIQAALDVALHYDTVVVAPGTYPERITFNNRQVALQGTDPDDEQVVAATVIDGGAAGTVVTFGGFEWPFAALRGLTIRNGAASDHGGGIRGNASLATIDRCIVDRNAATNAGAGISTCAGLITNCRITNNVGGGNGGGLAACTGTIAGCLIANNRGNNGGGIQIGSATLYNCRIQRNRASRGGGVGPGSGRMTACEITDNVSSNPGGGLYNYVGVMTNCIVARNRNQGFTDCSPTLVHCTVVDNRGEGFSGSLSRPITLRNTILARNYPYNVQISSSVETTFDHCCIAGGLRTVLDSGQRAIWGLGNIFPDPDFAFRDDFHLMPGSACIDAALDLGVPDDAEGRPRPLGAAADIGAYEWPAAAPAIALSPQALTLRGTVGAVESDAAVLTLRNAGAGTLAWQASTDAAWLSVDPPEGTAGATPLSIVVKASVATLPEREYSATVTVATQDGSAPVVQVPLRLAVGRHYRVNPDGSGDFVQIQPALNAAVPGTLIEVSPARYPERLQIGGRWIELRSQNPLDPAVVRATVVDATGGGSVITFQGSEGPETIIRGLTITGAGGTGAVGLNIVGTIGTDRPRATIDRCLIARNSGGAARYQSGVFVDCTFVDNQSGIDSGIVDRSDGTLQRCLFSGNTAVTGGGLRNYVGWVDACVFVGNSGAGGALLGFYGQVADSVFFGNTAKGGSGGAIAGSGGVLKNSLIFANQADDLGGGISDWRGTI